MMPIQIKRLSEAEIIERENAVARLLDRLDGFIGLAEDSLRQEWLDRLTEIEERISDLKVDELLSYIRELQGR